MGTLGVERPLGEPAATGSAASRAVREARDGDPAQLASVCCVSLLPEGTGLALEPEEGLPAPSLVVGMDIIRGLQLQQAQPADVLQKSLCGVAEQQQRIPPDARGTAIGQVHVPQCRVSAACMMACRFVSRVHHSGGRCTTGPAS